MRVVCGVPPPVAVESPCRDTSGRPGPFTILAVAVLTLAVSDAAVPPSPANEPATLLKSYLGFGDADVRALERGRPIKRSLEPTDGREVAVVGAVRIGVPRQYFVGRLRNITEFKKGPAVLQIGRFGISPSLADVGGLTLDDTDLHDLKECRMGDCGLKLSADMIRRVRTEILWSAPDAAAQATVLVRNMLVADAQAYLWRGDAALGEYRSRRRPVALADELRALIDASPFLTAYAPELRRYLEAFPFAELSGGENILYWSKETFNLKPIISLTHTAIHTATRGGTSMTLVASKGLYASHYLDGSLSLTVVLDAGTTGNAVDLVYVNRTRVDALDGAFGGLRRWIVERRVRGALEETLADVKARLEAAYLAER